jgi:hypothetical protein
MAVAGFWLDKSPCWKILDCADEIACRCVAHRKPERPCWDHPDTLCKEVLELPLECKDCKVFKLYAG